MAGLTWQDLGKLYLDSVGDTAAAQREKWLHLTEGYRRVASQLDIPELTQPDARVTIAADPGGGFLDYVELDCDLYGIRSVFNVTDGRPVDLEDGDARGRDRYLGTDARPPEGAVVKALRVGNRIYVRDRPSVSTTLKIMFKVQVPDLDDSYLTKHPLVPAQYHYAILNEAIASYFTLHPEKNEGGFRSYAPTREHRQQAQMILGASEDPKAIEDRAKRGRFRLRGMRFSVRSMR